MTLPKCTFAKNGQKKIGFFFGLQMAGKTFKSQLNGSLSLYALSHTESENNNTVWLGVIIFWLSVTIFW